MPMPIRRARPALAFVAALAFAVPPALADGWQTYVNERFGTTAEVPADWTPGEPPENGDGLSFTSPDGTATITVSGGLQAFDTVAESVAIMAEPLDGETITYKHEGPKLLVVSGLNGDRIFYRKSILSCEDEIWNTVSLDYPKARKKEFDDLVKHVADSLHAGTGWQSDTCDQAERSSPATDAATSAASSQPSVPAAKAGDP